MSLPLQGLHLSSPSTITHLSLLHNISSLYFLLSSFEDIRVHETRCRDSPSTGGLLFLVSSPPSPLFSLFVHIFYFNSTLSYIYFFSLFCFYFFFNFSLLKGTETHVSHYCSQTHQVFYVDCDTIWKEYVKRNERGRKSRKRRRWSGEGRESRK